MRKSLIVAILGLATVTTVKAQSFVQLYNYGTPSAGSIVYGVLSGGPIGTPVAGSSGFTVGLYWAPGNVVASINSLIGGATTTAGANQGSLAGVGGLTFATGPGALVALGVDGPGIYDATGVAVLNPSGGAQQYTLVLVAYSGSSYESSNGGGSWGHSAAFLMTSYTPPTPADSGVYVGNFAPPAGFAVVNTPEPSTFAIVGLGLASVLIFRRRK